MARIFAICMVAYALSQMDLALFGYALPELRREWGLDLTTVGLSVSAAFVAGGLLLAALGNLTDRFGRRSMLLFGTIAAPLFVAAHAFAPGIVALTILRGFAVATGGLSYPVTGALVSEEAPARWRGIYTGLLQVGYPLGWLFGSLLAAPLVQRFGWRAVFLVALASLPGALLVWKALPESRRFAAAAASGAAQAVERGRVAELWAPGIRRRAVTLFLAQFTFVIAYGGTSLLFPLYFREARGFELATSIYLVGFGNGIAVIGYVAAAFVGEFLISRRNTVVTWTMLGALAFLWLVWGTTTPGESLAAFGVMAMFFYGAAAVKFAYLAEVFPTRLRATGLAVCGSLAVSFGTALGPPLIGWVKDGYGWNVAFSLLGAVPLFTAGLLYLMLKPLPSGLELEDVERELAAR